MSLSWLPDSNIVLRASQPLHPQHDEALLAVQRLLRRGERVCVVPQVLMEFWVVATRPLDARGLGYTQLEAEAELKRFESLLEVLPETEAVYPEWRRLVVAHKVSGLPAHDARLVAAMGVHGIDCLVTFNVKHFKRYAGIRVVHPSEIAA